MAENNLILYKKTEELLYKVYPRLVNFPKSEKFGLCENIKQNFYEFLTYVSLANNVKSKRVSYLQQADGYLQVLKTIFKIAKNRKYISVKFYQDIDLQITEINKMLSGYIKSSVQK